MRTLRRGLLYWLALVALFAMTRDVAAGFHGVDVRWGYTAIDAALFATISFWLMRAPRRTNRRARDSR